MQQDIDKSFFGSFETLEKVFDLNRKTDSRLPGTIFQKANDIRGEEMKRFPESFRMGSCSYDKVDGSYVSQGTRGRRK